MSRTYRKLTWSWCAGDNPYFSSDPIDDLPPMKGVKLKFWRKRDKKPFHKPGKEFKNMLTRIHKAKCKDAMRKCRELPINKRCHVWMYW